MSSSRCPKISRSTPTIERSVTCTRRAPQCEVLRGVSKVPLAHMQEDRTCSAAAREAVNASASLRGRRDRGADVLLCHGPAACQPFAQVAAVRVAHHAKARWRAARRAPDFTVPAPRSEMPCVCNAYAQCVLGCKVYYGTRRANASVGCVKTLGRARDVLAGARVSLKPAESSMELVGREEVV